MRALLLATAMTMPFSAAAFAEQAPPAGSLPLSQIISKVEAREKFTYVDDIELEHGYYEVTYHTTDGAKVKLNLDPKTGEVKTK